MNWGWDEDRDRANGLVAECVVQWVGMTILRKCERFIHHPWSSLWTNRESTFVTKPLWSDKNKNCWGRWFGTLVLWLSIYWEWNNHPTFIFFRGVGKPPTRLAVVLQFWESWKKGPGCCSLGQTSFETPGFRYVPFLLKLLHRRMTCLFGSVIPGLGSKWWKLESLSRKSKFSEYSSTGSNGW